MKDLMSYCGLVDAKIRASDKDLPVLQMTNLRWKLCEILWPSQNLGTLSISDNSWIAPWFKNCTSLC